MKRSFFPLIVSLLIFPGAAQASLLCSQVFNHKSFYEVFFGANRFAEQFYAEAVNRSEDVQRRMYESVSSSLRSDPENIDLISANFAMLSLTRGKYTSDSLASLTSAHATKILALMKRDGIEITDKLLSDFYHLNRKRGRTLHLAEAAARELVGRHPGGTAYRGSLIFILTRTKQLDEAILLAQEMQKLEPSEVKWYDLELAARHVLADPKNKDIYERSFYGKDNFNEMVRLGEIALSLTGISQRGLTSYIRALVETKDSASLGRELFEIEGLLDQALAMAKGKKAKAKVYFLYAQFFHKVGDANSAMHFLNLSIKADAPSYKGVRSLFMDQLREQGRESRTEEETPDWMRERAEDERPDWVVNQSDRTLFGD